MSTRVKAVVVLWIWIAVIFFGGFNLPGIPVAKEIALVALVMDNDAPDLIWKSEMEMAAEELRKEYPAVAVLDESPESVGSVKQGAAIEAEANKLGVPAVVLIGGNDEVIAAVAMAKKASEIVEQVHAQ